MYLVMIGWMYVVVMMAAAEATSTNGSLLGALVTLVLYGVLPLSIVMYLLYTPARRRARKALQQQEPTAAVASPLTEGVDPDQSGHAAGDPVSAVRKEP